MKLHRIILMSSIAALAACNDDGESGLDLGYTGTTEAVAITETNDTQVFEEFNSGVNNLGVASDSSESASDAGSNIQLGKIVNKLKVTARETTSLDGLDGSGLDDLFSSLGRIDINETMVGTCVGSEGTQTIQGYIDLSTGAMSITAVANNYCENDETTNGTISINGQSNFETGASTMNASFTNFSITSATESVTLVGEMAMQEQTTTSGTVETSSGTATFNLKATDTLANIEYMFENFVVTFEEVSDYASFSAGTGTESYNGRIFQSDLGYLDIATTTDFTFDYSVSDNPTAGAMTLTGGSGAVITLTVVDNTSYTLTTDVEGDGTAENEVTNTWDSASGDLFFN